jgi:hypothetical protein
MPRRSRQTARRTAPAGSRADRSDTRLPDAGTDARVAWITRLGLLLIAGAAAALVVYVRLRLAGIPLERDEGEYAYAGQLILGGVPPYLLAYNMKFPGTYYAYAALMAVFGQTAWGIRVGLLCVHLASAALLFLAGRRAVGTLAAGIGSVVFMILALDRWSMGVFAHATHFVLLPVLAALVLLERASRTGRPWTFVAAGALAGLAIVMKQQALPFGLLAIGLAAWSGRGEGGRSIWRRAGLVIAGLGAAFGLMVVVLAAEGVLGRFWFWTFKYAAAYVSEIPLSVGMAVFAAASTYVTQATRWFWYAGLAGLALLMAIRWTGHSRRFLVAWVVAAAAAVVPGFFFRPHYFILLMPVIGLLAGVAAASIDRVLAGPAGPIAARVISLALFAGLVIAHVQRVSHFLFRMPETELVRTLYAENPFLEAPEIGRYLAAHTSPDDRIAVLGSEPEILFYAHRPSATGYIYTYALMEPQPYAEQMRDEMRREVEAARAPYLVFVGLRPSWGTRPGSDMEILSWAADYATRCYDLAGIAEVDPRQGPSIRWDAEAAAYRPKLETLVTIFRRKPGSPCGGFGSP